MRYSDNLERSEIKSLIEAYTALGNMLNKVFVDPDLDKLKGIKGDLLSLNIHTSHMKNVVAQAYRMLGKPAPDEQRGEHSEAKPSTAKIECEVHIMNSDKVCDVCGKSQIEIAMETKP